MNTSGDQRTKTGTYNGRRWILLLVLTGIAGGWLYAEEAIDPEMRDVHDRRDSGRELLLRLFDRRTIQMRPFQRFMQLAVSGSSSPRNPPNGSRTKSATAARLSPTSGHRHHLSQRQILSELFGFVMGQETSPQSPCSRIRRSTRPTPIISGLTREKLSVPPMIGRKLQYHRRGYLCTGCRG
jgi:hypothetical protein